MKKFILLLGLLIFNSSIFLAQEQEKQTIDPYSEAVKKCIKSNGTYKYYAEVVDQMFTMMQQQYASQNVPNQVWDELKQTKNETLEELGQMIVSAYRGHFTLKDVNYMNAFYATDIGKNMFVNGYKLTEGDKVAIAEFYKSETGEKIISSQQSLEDAMRQISEFWSKDFYASIVDKLSEKGYTI